MSTPLKNRALALLTNLLTIALFSTSAFAAPPSKARPANPPPQPNEPPALPAEVALRCPAKFIVALTSDAHGNIWVGTEDSGVFKYDPRAGDPKAAWTHFTTKDGLGDNNGYALACDHQGRIWVGHLNHGVSVYNGRTWQNYNVVQGLPRDDVPEKDDPRPALAGPLGPRVFAIAVSPKDGDVYIATDAGLTRYSPAANAWSYVTRAEGLPSNQIAAIAFAHDGTIYVGTQCDGLATASPDDHFTHWRTISCPPEYQQRVPLVPAGEGLPTNLINCLFVSADDTLYVGTPTGLASSRDHARSFNFLRGRDYAAKVRGLYGGPPSGWSAPRKGFLNTLLSEDYITGIAQDTQGRLWLAYRESGYQIIDPGTRRQYKSINDQALAKTDGYISAVLPLPNGDPLIARYGGSISAFIKKSTPSLAATQLPPAPGNTTSRLASAKNKVNASPADAPVLPAGAKPPTATELRTMTARVCTTPIEMPSAVFGGDDWITQGDWVGHYGQKYAVLAAMSTPFDHTISWYNAIKFEHWIGPHAKPGDGLRGWINGLQPAGPKSLYNPIFGYRRQADWDDHGEAYPWTLDGPDISLALGLPEGDYNVSLYMFNKDGHGGNNRCRDYLVEVRPIEGTLEQTWSHPPAAHARVRDFWGGVYKQFALKGPRRYSIRIARNYSFNTACCGVFIDRLAGKAEYSDALPRPWFGDLRYDPPAVKPDEICQGKANADDRLRVRAAVDLWKKLDASRPRSNLLPAQRFFRLQAYRAAAAAHASDQLLANWRWHLRLWSQADRAALYDFEKLAWDAQCRITPEIKTGGVVPQDNLNPKKH